jgi:hypothetical protein
MFAYPSRDLLRERSLSVMATQAGSDVIVRVDGMVVYASPKPDSALLSPTATVVVATMVGHPGPRSVGKTYGPITIADHKRVGALVAYLNAIPPPAPSTSNCPAVRADDHAGLTLAFWTSVGGRPSGRVTMELVACGLMSVDPVYGTDTYLDRSAVSVRRILEILGLNWPPP